MNLHVLPTSRLLQVSDEQRYHCASIVEWIRLVLFFILSNYFNSECFVLLRLVSWAVFCYFTHFLVIIHCVFPSKDHLPLSSLLCLFLFRKIYLFRGIKLCHLGPPFVLIFCIKVSYSSVFKINEKNNRKRPWSHCKTSANFHKLTKPSQILK